MRGGIICCLVMDDERETLVFCVGNTNCRVGLVTGENTVWKTFPNLVLGRSRQCSGGMMPFMDRDFFVGSEVYMIYDPLENRNKRFHTPPTAGTLAIRTVNPGASCVAAE